MKKLILVILVFQFCISSWNCGSSSNIKSINDDINYEDLFQDGDRIIFDISKSMSIINKKVSTRKKWADALQYVVSGFGGLTTAILAVNSSEPTNAKNTMGIVGASVTLASGIAMIFISPSENDVTCKEEWAKIKTKWEDAPDSTRKIVIIKSAILFANEHGLLTAEFVSKMKMRSK